MRNITEKAKKILLGIPTRSIRAEPIGDSNGF